MKNSWLLLLLRKRTFQIAMQVPLCICFVLAGQKSHGQLKANFTADTVKGCAPMVVHFTDQSTGNPNSWLWDFGDGSTPVNFPNPVAVYSKPGVYTVTLTVGDGVTTNTLQRTSYITVSDTPKVEFLVSPSSGCYPLMVNFKDGSNPGSGSIVNWDWDFGDGVVGHDPNPAHLYDSAGNFNVTLSVENTAGCIRAVTQQNAVVTNEGVSVDFSADQTVSCSAPFTVSFTATTTSTQPVNYLWDFGDGHTAPGKTVSHTYAQNGAFSVKLIASTAGGCPDTVFKENYIHINSFTSDFALPEGCAKVPLSFKNTSAPLPPSAVWDFGDGTPAVSGVDATHTYNAAGTYNIKLTNNFPGCPQTVTKTLTTFPSAQAAFSADNQTFCAAPATVSFQDNSQGATKWSWNFGDGKTSTSQNPKHVYQTAGAFDVTLVVSNANGCTDTLTKKAYIHVYDPQVQFTAPAVTGCIPFTTQFQSSVQSSSPIQSYQWTFGDGATSTQANPSHQFTTEGNFDVQLIVTLASGCKDTISRKDFIRTGKPVTVAFDATPRTGCLETPIQFTNQSQPKGLAWTWNFPQDNSTESTENPLHHFHTLGTHDVTLTVNNNGCEMSLTKQDFITIKAPKASFTATRSCTDHFTIQFTDASQSAQTWEWNFGDNTTFIGPNPPAHRFPHTGLFDVVLKVKNGDCMSSDTMHVNIIDEHPVLQVPTAPACHGDSMTLSVTGITDPGLIKAYQWDLGDRQVINTNVPEVRVAYPKSGTYSAQVTVTDLNGCKTASPAAQISIRGPKAAFTMPANTACPGATINFQDESTVNPENAAITQWAWDFGDGQGDTTTSSHPFSHTYQTGGKYTIHLKVTDANGCSDDTSAVNAVSIFAAHANFSTPDTMVCPGAPVHWNNTSTGSGLTYAWDFGDNTSSADRVPAKSYADEGIFSVSLKISTSDGCQDDTTILNYIRVGRPQPKMKYSDNAATCPPFTVTVVNESLNYRRIFWDFGDGTTSTLDSAQHIYNIPGNYRLRMLVYGFSGDCIDSIIKPVFVAGPYGQAFIDDSAGCSPLGVRFSANAVNAVSYRWIFGDGSQSQDSPDDAATHTYTQKGRFQPTLLLTDDRGCTVPILAKNSVTVDSIGTKATFSWPEICDSNYVQFGTEGTIFSVDVLHETATYHWDFGYPGSGDVSTEVHPVFRYPQAGDYQAWVRINTAYGCTATDSVDVHIPDSLSMQLQVTGDTGVCRGTPVQLSVSGGETYTWSPGLGLSDPSSDRPVATPDSSTTYQVIGNSKGNCQSDTAMVHVDIYPIPEVNAGEDQTAPTGSVIDLQASGSADIVNWDWTPPDYLSCTHCANPSSTPRQPITYTVTGTNGYGCSDSDQVKVILVCNEGAVYIPNTFTPNSDGQNDYFYPRGRGVQQVVYFRIYNRWGQLIYERNNFQLNDKAGGWDGTFKGRKLLPDVFMYSVSMICDNNEVFQVKGNITLLR